MTTPRRVAVTGLGLVASLGASPEAFFQKLLAGESGIDFLATDDAAHPVAIPASRCAGFDAAAVLGRARAGSMDRVSQLGAAAAVAAWRDAGFDESAATERGDAGVAWGTAIGGAMTYDRAYRDLFQAGRTRVSPLSVVMGMNSAAASHIAIHLALAGPCLTGSVACASAAVAIGEAFRRVRAGEVNLMLAGGSDAPFGLSVIRAWEALQVLAPGDAASAHAPCRPFQTDRAGLVLGEGAGALVLEDWEHAMARRAMIHAELVGYGTTCDHVHLVRPDAAGQARAIALALADAGLAPEAIGYINAHGTATREGDPIEVTAIRTALGDAAETIPVSSTKGMHGHLMGASGAVEAIATVLALKAGLAPPTARSGQIDPVCAGVRHIFGEPAPITGRAALSNSFAFGGSNAVLAFRVA